MKDISRLIDSTLLKAETTQTQIHDLCVEAAREHFKTVCINPCWVSYAASLLKGTDTGVCTVIGFPLGAMTPAAKAFEAKQAILDGADEIDMVLNIGRLKGGDDSYVRDEIHLVKEACGERTLKVILECCLLTDEEKERACRLSVEAGADFVKTSTGFSTHGATLEDVKLMKRVVGDKCHVKAAGGVRDYHTLVAMVEAGADRIGTSNGRALVDGAKQAGN